MKDICVFPPTARLACRKTVVKLVTIKDFIAVREMFEKERIDLFSCKLESETKKQYDIRNLPINMDIKDITESLDEQGIITSRKYNLIQLNQRKNKRRTKSKLSHHD